MQYCPKCKIKIRGKKTCCPMCQGPLKEVEGGEESSVWEGAGVNEEKEEE